MAKDLNTYTRKRIHFLVTFKLQNKLEPPPRPSPPSLGSWSSAASPCRGGSRTTSISTTSRCWSLGPTTPGSKTDTLRRRSFPTLSLRLPGRSWVVSFTLEDLAVGLRERRFRFDYVAVAIAGLWSYRARWTELNRKYCLCTLTARSSGGHMSYAHAQKKVAKNHTIQFGPTKD